MLTRMFPQPENRDRVSRIMAMPPPDFGPRPEKARFHRELFPAVVEISRDVLVQCFDPPSIQGGNRPRDPAKTNTGWTHIEIRDHPEAPFTHAYALAVTSVPPNMPKGIKIFELLLNTTKLSSHVYEGPARSRSPSRPPQTEASDSDAGPSASSMGRERPSLIPTSVERIRDEEASTSGRS